MSIFETLRTAIHSLRINALRSFLSMLGIIIGVGAVISVISIGTGGRQQVLNQMSTLGSNLITIYPSVPRGTAARIQQDVQSKFTLEMADDLEKAIPYIKNVVPNVSGRGLFLAGGVNSFATLNGVTFNYQEVMNHKVARGRFLSDFDVENENMVVVLGSELATQLFEESDPIGREVNLIIGNRRFTLQVIGVMESRGQAMMGFGMDLQAYVPVTTMMRRIQKTRSVSSFSAQAISSDKANEAVEQLTHYFTQILGNSELFRIMSQDQLLETINQMTMTLSIMLGGIASIALLVGGIGIMNIMLVSVTERTREIGIRKALGAKRRHILIQFLIEAMVLSSIGGLIGLSFGWAGAQLIGKYAGWPGIVTHWSIALALGFSCSIGIIFGIFPAVKASRLDPVQALSYE